LHRFPDIISYFPKFKDITWPTFGSIYHASASTPQYQSAHQFWSA